ncbi:MFS transporter [Deminuibacter soli]|uniref:MFS transporter n=1 Tax=Deminuibacter soli TaxID=2291815 RepID=A0A3E1NDB3_9BACT|nr:MFS transporter [Deminuibacter soli]RFM25975.1 MFS transporter [Deminuibacter soli]
MFSHLVFASKNYSAALRTRVAVAVFFFISGFTLASWASRIPSLQQQLHLNNAELGTLLFAMPLGLLLTLPFTGILLSRISSRYIMLGGALLYAVLLPVLGLVQHSWQLGVILFLFGSSRNFLNIAVNAQSVGVQQLYNKSIIASFHGIWSVAGFSAAALGTYMLSANVSPLYHFLVVGAATLIMIAFSFGDTLKQDVPSSGKKPILVLPDRPLLKLGLVAFCSMAVEGTMYDWSVIYFQHEVKGAAGHIGLGYTVYMCAMAAARFAGDKLVNKYGVKKLLQLSGLLVAAGLGIAVAFPYFYAAMAGFILTGFGISCVIPMVFAVSGKNTRLSPGHAIAGVSIVSYIGFLLVPPMMGYVAEAINLRVAFGIIVCSGIGITFFSSKIAK